MKGVFFLFLDSHCKYQEYHKYIWWERDEEGYGNVRNGGIHFLSKEIIFSFRRDPKGTQQKVFPSFLAAS